MSTPAEKDSERSSRQRGSSECKPLIDAATKDLFRKNAFRITGLSVDATILEITKHANKLKMMEELGHGESVHTAAFALKPPPTVDEIREAIGNLNDPEKRLIDEFFWFWPKEFGKSQSDPAIQALVKGDSEAALKIWSAKEEHSTDGVVAAHNLALAYHIAALDWENYSAKNEVETEQRQKISDYWREAFKRWERLATDETFWEKVTARVRQLNEPNLPTGFTRRMRTTLPEALNKINAELAVAFAESGKIELARLHIQFMRETNQRLDNVEKTAELVLTPARNRLKEQIQRAKQSAQQHPATAHDAARILIEHAHPLLDVFDLFFGEQEHFQKELFDEAATTVVNCLVAYQRKTGDNETFVKLLERALPLAESVEVRRRIEENIGIGKGNLNAKKLDSVNGLLKAIQDSKEYPRARLDRFTAVAVNALNGAVAGMPYGATERNELFDSAAIVLRGISVDAWNQTKDIRTALDAIRLAIEYSRGSELRDNLLRDQTRLREISVDLQHPTISWNLHDLTPAALIRLKALKQGNPAGVGCLVVMAIFIVLGVIGSCNSTNNSSGSNSYTPPAPSVPAYTPPSVVPSAPAYTPSPTFGSEKADIEVERAVLESLKSQIASLGNEIDRDRLYLDRTSQFAVDEFNAKVHRYNTLAQQAKAATASFNEKVNNYNAKLRLYGR